MEEIFPSYPDALVDHNNEKHSAYCFNNTKNENRNDNYHIGAHRIDDNNNVNTNKSKNNNLDNGKDDI